MKNYGNKLPVKSKNKIKEKIKKRYNPLRKNKNEEENFYAETKE